MPDYSKTQIYKIVSKDSSITNFYIGSTTNWTKRKQSHKICCNNETIKKYNLKIYQIIRLNGGFDNFNMILVEDYPCENRRQAEQREQYWKDELKPDMNSIDVFINSLKKDDPNFHKEHYKIYNVRQKENKKLYGIKNKDKKSEYDREYRLKNKESILEQKKEYYEKNKESMLEQNKEYYEKNKESILEKNKVKNKLKNTCECGSIIRFTEIYRHKKTLKHISYIKSLK